MIIYFNDTNNIKNKNYNINSFFNDTNNDLYYKKTLFMGIIGIMKK